MRFKHWFIIGLFIVVCGVMIVLSLVVSNGFDVFKRDIIEKTHEISESFDSILFDLEETDVTIKMSEDGTNKIISKEKKKLYLEVFVVDGNLTIKENKEYVVDVLNITSTKMELYLNKKVFEKLIINGSTNDITIDSGFNFKEVMIDISTGDISISNLITDKLSIEVSTGDVCLKNINVAGDVSLKSSTGDTCLNNLISTSDLVIDTSTGDINIIGCDAKNMYITTSTGDVEATILTGKTFDVSTSTGHIIKPDNRNGGICRVRTSTGDVILRYH